MSAPDAAPAKPMGPPPTPFTPRLFTGVMGVLVAAMMSGLNSRLGGLILAGMRGAMGLGVDDGRWITTVYSAAELVAMPISGWLAITFSMRRYHMALVSAFALLALIIPFAPSFGWLLGLRAAQGLVGGALIPVLMAAALRFFPPSFKLYGLAIYSLTATFAPNLAVWLAGLWADGFGDLRLASWQALPLAALSLGMVGWGLPQDRLALGRLQSVDWLGLATGSAGLAMLIIGLDEGERLDWFASPFISFMLGGGLALFVVFLIAEWHHLNPFLQLRLLARRNLWLGFTLFVGTLLVAMSGALLPAMAMGELHGFRAPQIAPVALVISLSQLAVAPLVAMLLYRPWVDARWVMVAGYGLLALACGGGARITPDWMAAQFLPLQILQAFGQPMVIVSLLFLATGVVAPMEGPYVAGTVNTLRALGLFLGVVLVERIIAVRAAHHATALADFAGLALSGEGLADLPRHIGEQAFLLSLADAYRCLGALALLLMPFPLFLQRVRPATAQPPAAPAPSPVSVGA
jgi:DHA2 family multidrug resistance protein